MIRTLFLILIHSVLLLYCFNSYSFTLFRSKSSNSFVRKCTLNSINKPSRRLCIQLYNNDETKSFNDNTNSEQFTEWELEEKQLQFEETQELIQQFRTEEGDEEIPEYMLKLLDQFNEDGINGEREEAVPEAKLPVIAVIGRPNTGKSTIANRLTNSFKDGAIVFDEPGITRDRTYRVGSWCEYNFQVIDTGGIIFDDTNDMFAERIKQQALIALSEANVGILVCDGQEGLNRLDIEIAEWLRRHNKVPIYVAVNKCESLTLGIVQAQDFWSLGLGNPYPVSGIHGTGIGELLDEITVKNMNKVQNVLKENATNIAFIGRPNVGKSSLFNRLYGKERSIVSNVAGTTRDTIDVVVNIREDMKFRLIDTAGIRKKGKVDYGAEYLMVNRAFKAIRRSDVVILLLDAVDGIVEQDRILADRIVSEGRSCVIALNKWDAIPNKDDKSFLRAVENVRSSLPALRWAEVVVISALTGQRTEKLFDTIEYAAKQFQRRIPTGTLNEVVNDATMWMAPPTIGAKSGKIYYCIQTSVAPPTIVFFVNDPDMFTENYQRFLDRKIRDNLKFDATPIRMIFRGKSLRDVSRAAKKGPLTTLKLLGNQLNPSVSPPVAIKK